MAAALLATAPTAAANPFPNADIAQGKAYHEKLCVACHTRRFGGEEGGNVYTRENRRAKNPEGCVAEGLETFALAEALSTLGVTYGQGYGIAAPLPPEQLAEWAARWQNAPWRCYPAAPLATPLGALAYQWQVNHERGFANLAPLERCPITAYLATHYPEAAEVHAWHEALHRSAAAGDIAGWQQARDTLTEWLLAEALAQC